MERHKQLGDHMNEIEEQSDGDNSSGPDIADLHEDAKDAHRSLGRSLKACQRCVRAAMKNTKPPAPSEEDEEDDTETSAGDGHEDDDDKRNADYRRRKAELKALSRKS